jgi:hypothetical protein
MNNFIKNNFFLLAGEFLRNPNIHTANLLKKEIDRLVRVEDSWSFREQDGTHTLLSRGPVLRALAKAVPIEHSRWRLHVDEDIVGVFNTIEAAKTCAEQMIAIRTMDQ